MTMETHDALMAAPFAGIILAQFLAAFGYVWLKAFQQWNVIRLRYLLVWPFSIGMAAMEFYVFAVISVRLDPLLILAMGLGGGLGANSAMWMQTRWMGEAKSATKGDS